MKIRIYRGVVIFPKNVHGMYSARVDVPGGGEQVAADTLAGIKHLIWERLKHVSKSTRGLRQAGG